jgi:hypothetical protein
MPLEPEPTPTPSASPMAWSDALERCKRLDVATKMLAYEMSYGYLDGGPTWMASLERELRDEVRRLDDGDELPDELGKTLFAWRNASYMARHRKPSDLPESWKTPTPSSEPPMHAGGMAGGGDAYVPAQALLPDA